MRKRSRSARSAALAEAELALLRPRLLPLSAEQQSEATELLSELLLTAARRDKEPSMVPRGRADGRAPSRRNGTARDPGRGRLAA
jgi:hypothetical protein